MAKPTADCKAKDPQELVRLREQANLGQKELPRVSESSVQRVERGEGVTWIVADKIHKALREATQTIKTFDDLFVCDRKKADDGPRYAWKEIVPAAARVATRIFEEFHPDAVLTFPAASSLFAGLVFAKAAAASLRDAFRTPVYTALLLNKAGPEIEGYHSILTEPENPERRFKILLPKALFSYRKIAVIDDTIISGVTMRALRKEFRKPDYAHIVVTFACCVWHSGLRITERVPPEIRGIEQPVATEKFQMPWGDAFSFEDLPLELEGSASRAALAGGSGGI
jgi:adenine/guanine phosphoribosyltransferase-like PRPP-binding protein